MAVGLSLFGIVIPTQIYLSLQMRVLTIKERVRVIAFPLAAGGHLAGRTAGVAKVRAA
jgi:hypothetical protein